MNRATFLAACFAALCPVSVAFGAEAGCPDRLARAAEKRVFEVRSWAALYSAYNKFAECDDGGIAEGFSDSVGRLLSTRGGSLDRLFDLTKNDQYFQQFVVRHVDETLSPDTLGLIRNNVSQHCPAKAARLCRAILEATQL
jgi:hypothetical protein